MKTTVSTLLIALLTISYSFSYAQKNQCKKSFLVVQYNVENLFDTIHNPGKRDSEFLPIGRKEWNSKRYWDKENKIATVLQQINPKHFPDLISLVEIEDQRVLDDLISRPELQKAHYKIVHRESPDMRGIDCALLYNPKTFKLISKNFYKVSMKSNPNFKTREILYAKGLSAAGDTLNVFVNHWPSRRGGMEKSEPKRNLAASVLRQAVDSLFKVNPKAKIIILGDFNDETNNHSIEKTLAATADIHRATPFLYNMASIEDQQGLGSYHYWKTNEWNMIDQMIISNALLNATSGLETKDNQINIFRPDWILHTDKDGTKVPARTYGRTYYGGYSDHLPIYQYFYYHCR